MNTIDIQDDKIILHWDGTLPPGIDPSRVDPEDVPHFWEHLRGFVRYSKSRRQFYLTFSKQNLKRIHRQFGTIPVRWGKEKLDGLKDKVSRLNSVVDKAMKIKTVPLEQLPAYNYKVPPIGEYQHRGVVFLRNTPVAPLFADCGVGKTYMTLVSTELQIQSGQISSGKTLVCGKLATLFSGWMEDCAKFTNLKANVLWVPRKGKYANTRNRHEEILRRLNDPADLYLINHDGVRLFEDQLAEKKFEKVVVDESTILKGFHGESDRIKGGAFGKALMNVARYAPWRVVMSGTPMPNGPMDLWGQFYFLDPDGLLLEPSFVDYRTDTYDGIKLGRDRGPRTPTKWVVKKDAVDRVASIVSPIQYRVRLRDVQPDFPPLTQIVREVEMSAGQQKHYDDMKKQLKVEINDTRIAISVRLTQLMKLRQITGGFIIDHNDVTHQIDDSAKLEAMDSLIEDEIDHQEKVVIFCEYRWEIETLRDRYKHFNAVTIYGGNTTVENHENIKRFKTDPSVRLVICQPQAAAHGLTFTESHYMIFYSISHSAEFNYQAKARIERTGQKHAMFVYYILCKGSVDSAIYRAIQNKNEAQQALIDQELLAFASEL